MARFCPGSEVYRFKLLSKQTSFSLNLQISEQFLSLSVTSQLQVFYILSILKLLLVIFASVYMWEPESGLQD